MDELESLWLKLLDKPTYHTPVDVDTFLPLKLLASALLNEINRLSITTETDPRKSPCIHSRKNKENLSDSGDIKVKNSPKCKDKTSFQRSNNTLQKRFNLDELDVNKLDVNNKLAASEGLVDSNKLVKRVSSSCAIKPGAKKRQSINVSSIGIPDLDKNISDIFHGDKLMDESDLFESFANHQSKSNDKIDVSMNAKEITGFDQSTPKLGHRQIRLAKSSTKSPISLLKLQKLNVQTRQSNDDKPLINKVRVIDNMDETYYSPHTTVCKSVKIAQMNLTEPNNEMVKIDEMLDELDKMEQKLSREKTSNVQMDESLSDKLENKKTNVLYGYNALPQQNKPIPFKYKRGRVLNKCERANMKGHDCDNCKKFYNALYNCGDEDVQQRKNKVSKHRDHFSPPPPTPKGFWKPYFTPTQDDNK